MAKLFEPITLRGMTFRNRVWVSPMCQYSANSDGLADSWHLVHLGQFAVGGAGLVMTEATAVTPEGRISPFDTGLWADQHIEAWKPIVRFIQEQGARAGIQLAHSGRKGSTAPPWVKQTYVTPADGGWTTVAPSEVAFGTLPTPAALHRDGIAEVIDNFRQAAIRASAAGFDVIELHAAHGYLLHQFLSPLSNRRTDSYGGDFVGRTRLLLEVFDAVRGVWPADRPIFVRVSATDWVEGGWDVDDTVQLSRLLAERGADLIDCSSGGNAPDAKIPLAPGYQVGFAERVRGEASIRTGAVGLIEHPQQAERILADGAADAIFLGRAMLREPHWALLAANTLGVELDWPAQYARAKPHS